jgi:hypothetical protein
MKPRVNAIGIFVVAAATLLSPAIGLAQGRRSVGSVRVVRPAVVIGGYYRPVFYDPFYFNSFYFDPYYRWYAPPYGYGGAFNREAALRLQVTPKETEVFVDGYFAGKVDEFDGVLQRLRVPPGEHDLQFYLPGHRSVQQKVYLQPGATFKVHYNLEPLGPGEPAPQRPVAPSAPAAPVAVAPRGIPSTAVAPRGNTPTAEAGILALRVQPGDAVVMIDGERWEGSPNADRLVVQLAPGVHRVEIRKDGFRPYSSEVMLRPGETQALNVALTR